MESDMRNFSRSGHNDISIVHFSDKHCRPAEDHDNSILSYLDFDPAGNVSTVEGDEVPVRNIIRDYLISVLDIDRIAVAPDFVQNGTFLDIPTLVCNERYRFEELSGDVTEQSFEDTEAIDFTL